MRSVVLLSVMLSPLALAVVGCGGDRRQTPPSRQDSVVVVETERISQQPWGTGLELAASVLPLYRATPGAVLMGRVDRVMVEEGAVVTKGQSLARIESRETAALLAQAGAGVAAARAMETNARRMSDRMKRLHTRNAASDRDLEDAQTGHEAALAQLEAAEEAVRVAEVYVDHSEIVAPFSGVVVEKRVEVGDTASPGVPLFVIDDLSQVKIEAQVPESAATHLAIGDPVRIEFQGTTYDGSLSEILPTADPRTRTFTVRALLDNAEGRLRPGMFARLSLFGGERVALVVPLTAIVRRGPLTGVFVIRQPEEGRAVAGLRWITIGDVRDGRVEVLTGLAVDERVVLNPGSRLADGQAVEVRE